MEINHEINARRKNTSQTNHEESIETLNNHHEKHLSKCRLAKTFLLQKTPTPQQKQKAAMKMNRKTKHPPENLQKKKEINEEPKHNHENQLTTCTLAKNNMLCENIPNNYKPNKRHENQSPK